MTLFPTDRPAKPFAIGISPLGDRPWLITDQRLPAYLSEKAALTVGLGEHVFMAEPGTEAAQAETLERVATWQVEHHPAVFSRRGDAVAIAGGPEPVRLDTDRPPLATAAALCAEDLVLMRRGETGWRLAASSLCFPSSWRLAEKFARPLEEVHRTVPGFARGTRNAELINRMFDKLQPDLPLLRGNWSFYTDDRLHHPESHHLQGIRRFDDPEQVYLRDERQTLTRLPGCGDILFTILITLTPLTALQDAPDGPAKAAALAEQLAAMNADELAYKALAGHRDALTRLLSQIARATV